MGNRDISLELEGVVVNLRAAAFIQHRQSVLLQRKIGDSFYAPIGGRIKIGETSESALKRELDEELGLSLEIKGLLFVLENFTKINNKDYQEISFIYETESTPQLLKKGDSFIIDDVEFRWLSKKELDSKTYEIKPEILNQIKDWFPESIEHIVNVDRSLI